MGIKKDRLPPVFFDGGELVKELYDKLLYVHLGGGF